MENIFGEVIYRYTRAQAIADGVLVDCTPTAREAGFKWPVAITAGVFHAIIPSEYAVSMGQSYEGRLWDVLHMLRYAIKTSNGSIIKFTVKIGRKRENFKAVCSPGDTLEPVITIMLPTER